jgi:hypothetical protein
MACVPMRHAWMLPVWWSQPERLWRSLTETPQPLSQHDAPHMNNCDGKPFVSRSCAGKQLMPAHVHRRVDVAVTPLRVRDATLRNFQ